MRITSQSRRDRGFSLIELVVFMVVISIALGALLSVYQSSITRSVDPIVRVRLLELAQSQLDVILGYPYDAATPPGGVPACGSLTPTGAPTSDPCVGGGVSDFDGVCDSPPGYGCQVSVEEDVGASLGLQDDAAKRISVTTSAPNGESLTLSAYRTNF
ncbi:prepilin-type N-terminal cleavage/methylation domain-containing protein [Marinimicrobium sp. ABcell2]|uniref:type IV pilus modification PilV family protein n=1 Tax=Marinimicrobium sp. ABcell2 TaxID=3069751 RepID=UPI0027B1C5E2|nr:type II secretion system protein [Marinimicrobium sp. ABcell2]MDQ2075231.1 type II secretion system protein [Marinimicrobium sp. ABcell2]